MMRYTDVPNHHWMMTYLAITIAIVVNFNGSNAKGNVLDLRANVRWLLVVLMFFATMQKLASPDFMSGSYIGFEMVRGGFASPALKLTDAQSTIDANTELIDKLHAKHPGELNEVTLTPPVPFFDYFVYGFTILILAKEAWLFLAFLRFPDWWLTQLSLIAFATVLAVLRQEFTFISVVCTMGYLSCRPEQTRLRGIYTTLAIVTAACVLKTLNQ